MRRAGCSKHMTMRSSGASSLQQRAKWTHACSLARQHGGVQETLIHVQARKHSRPFDAQPNSRSVTSALAHDLSLTIEFQIEATNAVSVKMRWKKLLWRYSQAIHRLLPIAQGPASKPASCTGFLTNWDKQKKRTCLHGKSTLAGIFR